LSVILMSMVISARDADGIYYPNVFHVKHSV